MAVKSPCVFDRRRRFRWYIWVGFRDLNNAASTCMTPFSLPPAIWNATRKAIETCVPKSERVLVAVSGGADSLALLAILKYCEREMVVGHINHQTRGKESDEDEKWVREICAKWEIPYVARAVQVLVGPNQSFEMAAREARYQALAEIAREQNCVRIATGHTASDQLETVLLHWLRGAAVSGLRGMENRRWLDGNSLSLELVRPILDLARKDCETICAVLDLATREDSSNRDGKYLRNRVRHELIPLMENLLNANSARGRLARQTRRAAQLLGDDLNFLDEIAARELESLVLLRETNLLVLDGANLALLRTALARRVLRLAAREFGESVEANKVETARLQIVEEGRRAVWMWTRDLRVEWTGVHSGRRVRFQKLRN